MRVNRVETRTDRSPTFLQPLSFVKAELSFRTGINMDRTEHFHVSGPGLDTCRLLCVLSFDLEGSQPYQRYFNGTAQPGSTT